MGDETGRERERKKGTRGGRIINEFRGPAGFLSSAIPTLRCFDSLAVSNNIRYFYHIAAPVRFAAFIRVGTRFGTRVLRYFEIATPYTAALLRLLISWPRYTHPGEGIQGAPRTNDPSDTRTRENKIQSEGESFRRLRFSSKFIHSIIGPLAPANHALYKKTGAISSHRLIYLSSIFLSRLTTSRPVGIITHKK